MGGTLFLDALEKKERLKKGYPLGEGRDVKEQGFSVMRGRDSDTLPNDKDLYRVPSLLDRAIGRLKEAVKPEVDPTLQSKHNIEHRGEAEASPEGDVYRAPESIVNQGVPVKKGK